VEVGKRLESQLDQPIVKLFARTDSSTVAPKSMIEFVFDRGEHAQ